MVRFFLAHPVDIEIDRCVRRLSSSLKNSGRSIWKRTHFEGHDFMATSVWRHIYGI